MRITIFGTGYVGLVTGACLADVGHDVLCVDIDEDKVGQLNRGFIPIYEPGLEELVSHNTRSGRLAFTSDADAGIRFGTLIFIAVGTPSGKDNAADLSFVLNVATTIGTYMNGYKVVVNKSTVPVGTADTVEQQIVVALEARGKSFPFDVCSNPEFLKEGSAIEDFTKGARIIVGTNSSKAQEAMSECYAPYNRNHDKLMFMDVRSAELTKYAANAMLATKISFMNEIANLAECLGADIEHVRQGIGSDPRIGYHFIYPGCGYGGSCFPKDLRALAKTASEVGLSSPLIHAVETTNNDQKKILFRKLDQAFNGDLRGKTIAVWGLAFKPNTDDIRDAPSCDLMEALWARGARVQAYDPVAMAVTRERYGRLDNLLLAESKEAAVRGADALAVCTEWKQFRVIDFEWLKRELTNPIIVDGRNLYDPVSVRKHGIKYFAVGRGDSVKQS